MATATVDMVVAETSVPQEPLMTANGTSLPLLEPPPTAASEVLLGALAQIPEIWIVQSTQSQDAVAAQFHTTSAQLKRINPRLPDPIPAGSLVMLPVGYHASDGETISSIAETTGLAVESILAANQGVDPSGALPTGAVLAMPSLYIVQEVMAFEAAADTLGMPREMLLSANPNADETLNPGEVLVMPPTQ